MKPTDIYSKLGHPAAFSGVDRVKSYSNQPYSSVENDLQQSDAFTKKRVKFKPKLHNPFLIHKKREQIQMDLIDIHKYAHFNKGVRFLLVAIDCFTRKAAVVGITRKSAEKTLIAIKYVLEEELPPFPESVVFDRGTEFGNRQVRAYLSQHGIKYYNPNGLHKAAIAERFNRSIQRLIYSYMEDQKTKKYIEALPYLVKTYNSRTHRSIGMSPNEAEKSSNHAKVREKLGVHISQLIEKRKKSPLFKVGDRVRVKNSRINPHLFRRGYQNQFSDEIFVITNVKTHLIIPMYEVQNGDEEKLPFPLYASELQKVVL